MITTQLTNNRVELRAFGMLTLDDYKTFAEHANYRIHFNGPIDLLLDLRNMTDYSLDVLVAEMRYARKHTGDFRRIALLSEDQWVNWGMLMTRLLVGAELMIFSDETAALAWLQEGNDEAEPDQSATDFQSDVWH